MDKPMSAKEKLLEFASEKLLEKLTEYKDSKKKSASPHVEEQREKMEIAKPMSGHTEANHANHPHVLVRYQSVVQIDEFDGDYSSCMDSCEDFCDQSREFDAPTEPVHPPKSHEQTGSSGSPALNIPHNQEAQNAANNDLSNFVQKKSIAQGMMDLALVSANTNQLRYVIDIGSKHPYFFTSFFLIILSLALQLIVGLALIYNSRFNIRKRCEMKSADRINDLSIIGVFLITLINVFISTFNGSSTAPFAGEVIPMEPETDVGSDLGEADSNSNVYV
ncbi:ninjurin-B-like [Toxorhynchites rutilus septentrionalis]|uniref:ninjurin-B-like n=1 Tax=Toxorhynchites rutilus septentrionalis TaxID=329112 RepID=UPI0024785542|nr:ninjurin-B-like [Toxorhynchites rutilus septentrionalis]